jgi:hypothetical protein
VDSACCLREHVKVSCGTGEEGSGAQLQGQREGRQALKGEGVGPLEAGVWEVGVLAQVGVEDLFEQNGVHEALPIALDQRSNSLSCISSHQPSPLLAGSSTLPSSISAPLEAGALTALLP